MARLGGRELHLGQKEMIVVKPAPTNHALEDFPARLYSTGLDILGLTLLQLMPKRLDLLERLIGRQFTRRLQVANIADSLGKLLQIGIQHQMLRLDGSAITDMGIQKVVFGLLHGYHSPIIAINS